MKQNGTPAVFDRLMAFLNTLEQQRLAYDLAHHRDDALMVTVALPGERWEVEFLTDGSVEVEKFISNGEIGDAASLHELFAAQAEPQPQVLAILPH